MYTADDWELDNPPSFLIRSSFQIRASDTESQAVHANIQLPPSVYHSEPTQGTSGGTLMECGNSICVFSAHYTCKLITESLFESTWYRSCTCIYGPGITESNRYTPSFYDMKVLWNVCFPATQHSLESHSPECGQSLLHWGRKWRNYSRVTKNVISLY